jgi:hypothetical protein
MTAAGLLKLFQFRVSIAPAPLVLSARNRDVLKIFEHRPVSEHVQQSRISIILLQFLRVLVIRFDDSFRDISNVLSVTRWIFGMNIFQVLSLFCIPTWCKEA